MRTPKMKFPNVNAVVVRGADEIIPSDEAVCQTDRMDREAMDESRNVTFQFLYIGEPGDVKVEMENGDVVVLSNLMVGYWHPIAFYRVFETGTTAKGIIGGH